MCTKCGINERAARGSWCKPCRAVYQKAYNDRTRERPEKRTADCAICGARMEWMSGSGPDRVYCSTRCKRSADTAAQTERRRDAREVADPQVGALRRQRVALLNQGLRRCTNCGIVKPLDDYHRRGAGWQYRCATCTEVHGRDRAVQLRVISWHSHLSKKFGLTPDAWAAMLIAQQGRCAICSEAMLEPVVDHDHACCAHPTKTCGKCIRGLLCHGCNNGLGLFRDSVEKLEAAIRYLKQQSDVVGIDAPVDVLAWTPST